MAKSPVDISIFLQFGLIINDICHSGLVGNTDVRNTDVRNTDDVGLSPGTGRYIMARMPHKMLIFPHWIISERLNNHRDVNKWSSLNPCLLSLSLSRISVTREATGCTWAVRKGQIRF